MAKLYQDSEIMFLRFMEKRYNLVDEDLRKYFSNNIHTGEIKLEELKEDKQFYSLISQKYQVNNFMLNQYKKLLKEQFEIRNLIEFAIEKDCKNDMNK